MDNSNDDNDSTSSSVEEIDNDNIVQQHVPISTNHNLIGGMITLLSQQINHEIDRSITPPIPMLNPEILSVLLLNRNFDEMMNENAIINDDSEPIFWGEEQAIANSFYDRSPIRHVISENIVDNILKTKKYINVDNRNEHSKCPISLEYFKDDDDVIQLPCNHCFFEEPIRQWLMNDSHVCPICRFSFESMEININDQQSNNNGEENELDESEENAIEDSDAAEDAINNDEELMDIDNMSFSDEEKNDDYDNHQSIDEMILYNETQTFYDYDEVMSVSSENSDEYFFSEDYDSVD